MKKHNLNFNRQAVVTRYGCCRKCEDCFEKIYSEREWETSPCPGKILNEVPSAESAIKAIKEKSKLVRPSKPGKEFDEWMNKMDEIDKKYGFKS